MGNEKSDCPSKDGQFQSTVQCQSTILYTYTYSKLSHLTSNLQSHGTRLQCKHFGLTVMLQKGKKRQSSKRRKNSK
ncbi:hypothetical protein LTX96_0002993 [Nakaseomyces glabratus]|nr:hypothetical protein LTX96_0002993 [Nakaseomyces glabratus]